MELNYEHSHIKMAMVIHLHKLQRESLPALTYQHIEDTLRHLKWKRKFPTTLHEAVNDILSISADEIVQLLSSRAIIEGYHKKLEDFDDLIGGEINE